MKAYLIFFVVVLWTVGLALGMYPAVVFRLLTSVCDRIALARRIGTVIISVPRSYFFLAVFYTHRL